MNLSNYTVTASPVPRDLEEIIWARFYAKGLEARELNYYREFVWSFEKEEPVRIEDLDDWDVFYTSGTIEAPSQTAWKVSNDLIYVATITSSTTVLLSVQARNKETADVLYKRWLKKFPKPIEDKDDGKCVFNFWTQNQGGATFVTRRIDAPVWDDIMPNYSHNTKERLIELRDMSFDESKTGKLLLWHGEPGTGKTHALRALAQEWRGWCDFNFFVYPEQFFNSPDYMLQVLLRDQGQSEFYWDENDVRQKRKDAERWNLLIFEDAGEFLTKDAKVSQGQGLARLLNLADGILGQGMRVLILITTNEKINSFHEAVTREGRVSSSIDFKPLSVEEASEWAKANHKDLPDVLASGKKFTLAELYNQAINLPSGKPMGFA